MQSFDMLHTMCDPLECGTVRKGERFYIDGKRVSSREFHKLQDYAARRDTFTTQRKDGRILQRYVCYR